MSGKPEYGKSAPEMHGMQIQSALFSSGSTYFCLAAIVGADQLDFCVRDENRYFLTAITAVPLDGPFKNKHQLKSDSVSVSVFFSLLA